MSQLHQAVRLSVNRRQNRLGRSEQVISWRSIWARWDLQVPGKGGEPAVKLPRECKSQYLSDLLPNRASDAQQLDHEDHLELLFVRRMRQKSKNNSKHFS